METAAAWNEAAAAWTGNGGLKCFFFYNNLIRPSLDKRSATVSS